MFLIVYLLTIYLCQNKKVFIVEMSCSEIIVTGRYSGQGRLLQPETVSRQLERGSATAAAAAWAKVDTTCSLS